MSAIADARLLIQEEETNYRAAVSEATFKRFGATNNFIVNRVLTETNFNLNGQYNIFTTNADVDGKRTYPFAFEVVDLGIFSGVVNGTGGTTELDIKWKPQNSGAWASIFSTTPKFVYAASEGSCFIGQTVANFTAPVLSKTLFDAYDMLKIDIITAVDGSSLDYAGIKIFTRPR